jgi:hypothetical protein
MTEIQPYAEPEAQELDTQIRAIAKQAHIVLEALYALVEEARAGQIHLALGYPSWTAYIADALDGQWKLERDKRGEVMRYLAEQGMGTRAIARLTSVSKDTVSRELRGVPLGDAIGLDGKMYSRRQRAGVSPETPAVPRDLDDSATRHEHWVAGGDGNVIPSAPGLPAGVESRVRCVDKDCNGTAVYIPEFLEFIQSKLDRGKWTESVDHVPCRKRTKHDDDCQYCHDHHWFTNAITGDPVDILDAWDSYSGGRTCVQEAES